MYKTISNEIIRQFNPCYDPSKFITDENEELPIKDWVQKYRNAVPAKDILWLLLRREFLSEKDLRLFAVWCAREALKLVENPDERIIEACNMSEKFANGEATQEELHTAYAAAYAAYSTHAAYYASAYTARAARAAYYASDYAARAAANASDAAYYASEAAYFASEAAYVSARAAAYYAAYAAYAAQLDQLLTYFE